MAAIKKPQQRAAIQPAQKLPSPVTATDVWRSLCPIAPEAVPDAFASRTKLVMGKLTIRLSLADAKEKVALAQMCKKAAASKNVVGLSDASGVGMDMYRILADIRGLALSMRAVKALPATTPMKKGEYSGEPLVYSDLDLSKF